MTSSAGQRKQEHVEARLEEAHAHVQAVVAQAAEKGKVCLCFDGCNSHCVPLMLHTYASSP